MPTRTQLLIDNRCKPDHEPHWKRNIIQAPPAHRGSGKTSFLEMLPREIEISTHTRVHDMSPIDSYGYGNPSDEQTYEEEEHAQHPDAALEHNIMALSKQHLPTLQKLYCEMTHPIVLYPPRHMRFNNNRMLCCAPTLNRQFRYYLIRGQRNPNDRLH